MTSLVPYMEAVEYRIINKLVRKAIKDDYLIDVFDGEEWTVKLSNEPSSILLAMATTGQDVIRLRRDGKSAGIISFVYNGDADVICDHSDNAAINALVSHAMKGIAA